MFFEVTMRHNFKFTMLACYIAYLTQALVINFTPLLYVTFQTELELSLSQISLLIAINFLVGMIAFVVLKVLSKRYR